MGHCVLDSPEALSCRELLFVAKAKESLVRGPVRSVGFPGVCCQLYLDAGYSTGIWRRAVSFFSQFVFPHHAADGLFECF